MNQYSEDIRYGEKYISVAQYEPVTAYKEYYFKTYTDMYYYITSYGSGYYYSYAYLYYYSYFQYSYSWTAYSGNYMYGGGGAHYGYKSGYKDGSSLNRIYYYYPKYGVYYQQKYGTSYSEYVSSYRTYYSYSKAYYQYTNRVDTSYQYTYYT